MRAWPLVSLIITLSGVTALAFAAPADERPSIDQYIRTLQYDPRTLLAIPGEGSVTVPKQVDESLKAGPGSGNDKLVVVTVKKYSLSGNFDDVAIMQPTAGAIFPGSLIAADTELVNGRPRRLSEFEGNGAKVTLSINLPNLGTDATAQVENPTDSKVNAAIDSMVTRWLDHVQPKGTTHTSRKSWKLTRVYNDTQASLALGLNATSSRGSVSGSLNANVSSDKKVTVALFKQVFYTVTCDRPKNPSDMMAAGTNLALVKQICPGKTSPPAYVSNVSYGRMIIMRFESSKSTADADLDSAIKYASGDKSIDASAKAKIKQALESTDISVATIGGNPHGGAEAVIAKDPDALAALITKYAELKPDNRGEPIAYTVRFLKDDAIARMGYTTEYNTESFLEYPHGVIEISHKGAYNADFTITYTDMKLQNGKWVETPNTMAVDASGQRSPFLNRAVSWSTVVTIPPAAKNIRLTAVCIKGIRDKVVFVDRTFSSAPRVVAKTSATLFNPKCDIQDK